MLGPTRVLLPTAPIVYVADNAGFPYGTRTEAEIATRIPALLGRLVERFQPRLVVIACNTACTIALDQVRAALDVPVVGTVPAIKPAAEATRSGAIGVLGTKATIRQRYVDDLAEQFAAAESVIRHGSSELVELAERKLKGETVSVDQVYAAAAPLFAQPGGDSIDVVVLACTHFPLLEDELAQAFSGIAWVDGGEGIARRITYLTRGQPWPDSSPPGIAVFTGAMPGQHLARTLETHGLTRIEPI